MLRRLPLSFSLFVTLGACSAPPTPVTTPVPSPTTSATSVPAASSDAARAAEASLRLKADADKGPLLAAWGGPYGGVPPWNEVADMPVFHPDVRVWEVRDKATGAYRGGRVPRADAAHHQDRLCGLRRAEVTAVTALALFGPAHGAPPTRLYA